MSIQSTGLSDWEGALVVKPKVAWKMLGCSNTFGYQLLKARELDSYHDGRSRKIIVASIHRYIQRRLAATTKQLAPTEAAYLKGRRRGRPRKAERPAAEPS
jgi:hypothetical protein